MTTDELVAHYFRHEYGRAVAVLSRRVGVQHLEAVEDAVQMALVRALETWSRGGVPDNPSAWVFQVANNSLMGTLRKQTGRSRLLSKYAGDVPLSRQEEPACLMPGEVGDDLLRMLLVCCDDAIPQDSRLVLALKTLCGFSAREIGIRLFTSEANVYKRLERARKRLREEAHYFGEFSEEELVSRLPSVRRVLYLLFTEGYLSSHTDRAIRRELCDEAIRLTGILADHPAGRAPETHALLALMHLQRARMSARRNDAGGLLLLEEQDREQWDRHGIEIGLEWLARSAQGEAFSRYHAEAGIAAEHCLAPSFKETRWDRIAECYALLERVAPSPLHRLNRAVAVAEWQGPAAGLEVLEGFEPPGWLSGTYLWAAVLADLHRRCGHREKAGRHRDRALKSAPTPAIRTLLERRLRVSEPEHS